MSNQADNNNNSLQAAASAEDAAEEALLLEAMQRLKLLHIKARKLRGTIPRMIDPLIQKHPSPQVMFAAFMKAIQDAQADVKEFTELRQDETSRQVFAQAQKSREQNPLGITPWRHKDHPDWFTLDPK